MCGISGILTSSRTTALDAVRAMNAAQRHRGPNDEGVDAFDVPGGILALGHRRLSIIDLSSAGHQPMINPETGDWIVFNGEIYNFRELRSELESLGETFRSHSDTEVILKAFARWGDACFEKLCGMFALGLYSFARKELILARDPLGIKPLYFSWRGDEFAFASEVRALKAAKLAGDEIDRRAIAGMLAYGAVQQPLTMYTAVKSLEPGTWAAVDVSGVAKRRFVRTGRHWDFPEIIPADSGSLDRLRESLEVAVRSHLVSDVPVGIFLSAGIDSTAIAALCSEIRRDVDTFSIKLRDQPELDESHDAAKSALSMGLKHHIIDLSEADVRDQTLNWLAAQDQPSMDGLNTYVISKAVRERGIIVALSGLGGDEMFGGYPSFRDVPRMIALKKRIQPFPNLLVKAALGVAYWNKSSAQRQKAFDMARTPATLSAMYFRRKRLFSDSEMAALGFNAHELNLTPEFLPPECEPERGLPANDSEAAIAVLETRFYMGSTLLRDSDVCSMAHGLEKRVPLLDRRVISCALALPGLMRVPPTRSGPNKPLLVAAMGKRLPNHILAMKKRGFNLSQSTWMTGPLREAMGASISALKSAGWADARTVGTIWEQFQRRHKGPDWSRPWTLGVLGAWSASQQS